MRTEKAVIKARHSRATALRPTAAKQPMRERILIVCEGAKTEPHYFEEIRLFSRNSSATIEIYGKECGSAPLSVVQFAQQRWQESGKDFDQIFCVFDRDRHESFDQALARLHSLSKHGFKAIYSYPSFEYWLLLHFGYTRKCFVAQGYRSAGDILEKELSNHFVATFGCPYKKGMTDVSLCSGLHCILPSHCYPRLGRNRCAGYRKKQRGSQRHTGTRLLAPWV